MIQEGRGWIPLSVRAKVGEHVGEQQVLCLRWWLGESSSVVEDVEMVRKESTPPLGESNVFKWKRSGMVGQIVSEEELGLLLCPGFYD